MEELKLARHIHFKPRWSELQMLMFDTGYGAKMRHSDTFMRTLEPNKTYYISNCAVKMHD